MSVSECLTGATQLILTPALDHSTVILFMRFSTPALAAPECLQRERERERERERGKVSSSTIVISQKHGVQLNGSRERE